MKKEVIGTNQLFAMIILFELGTAIVIPIGLETGHTIWLSILLALPGGVLLYLIFHDLYCQYPNLIISGYTQKILGKTIGWPLSFLYIPVLVFNGSRILRESGDLLIAASYDQTPVFIINAIMVTAVIYILNKGIEVFFRTSEIYLIVIFFMGFICFFVVIAAGLVDFKNLFPLHAVDWKQALRSAFPNILTFPFGELICMTTIFPHLQKSCQSRKTGIAAIVLSGILLCSTHAIEISVLGKNIYERSTFPMYTTITLVNLANFIQRLDALVILTLIIGVFFKMTLYCYAVIAVTADLFKVQDTRRMAIPVGVVVLFGSLISAENYPRHLEEGAFFLRYILSVLFTAIPIMLFVVHRVRKRLGLLR